MPTQHSSDPPSPTRNVHGQTDPHILTLQAPARLSHKHIGLLRELLELCDDEQQTIRRLALLSAVAVLRDLLPGYRIRLPTEKELRVQVSQEVEALRRYEKQLLDGYEHVVLTLRKWLGTAGAQRVAAARGVCALLVKARDFNCRDQLVEAVVKLCDAADAAVRAGSVRSASGALRRRRAGRSEPARREPGLCPPPSDACNPAGRRKRPVRDTPPPRRWRPFSAPRRSTCSPRCCVAGCCCGSTVRDQRRRRRAGAPRSGSASWTRWRASWLRRLGAARIRTACKV